MELINISTKINKFDTLKDFFMEFQVGQKDLILTHEFLYDGFMKDLNTSSSYIMQEKYGTGEPSDEMMNNILKDIKDIDFERIIAIGGGTVLDIAKILVLKDIEDVVDAFEKTVPLVKEKELIAVPTTCGTGSEVTNITIAELKSKGTKMGLAVKELIPDHAVLIPELIKGLPFKFYGYSSVDALIHAVESHVSPKSNPYTKLFSEKAIRIILDIYLNIAESGEDYRFERLEDMLIASNYAGIAFGNTGVGAVHALSYPLGGTYHVPHGEANYQFFTEVFKVYSRKNPDGRIKELNKILSEALNTLEENVYEELDSLLGKIMSKNPLNTYGMKDEEVKGFANKVINTQQRLLNNNYVELSGSEIEAIYRALY